MNRVAVERTILQLLSGSGLSSNATSRMPAAEAAPDQGVFFACEVKASGFEEGWVRTGIKKYA